MTVKSGSREINCHKMVLCSKAAYFKKLCGPGGRFKEADLAVIELHGDDEEVAEAVLAHLYGIEYSKHFRSKINDAMFHFKVWVAGAKYLAPQLQDEAAAGLVVALTDLVDLEEIQQLLEQHWKYRGKCSSMDGLLDQLRTDNLYRLLALPSFRGMIWTDEVV